MQYFLVKVAGSNGCVYDFSHASVEDTNSLRKMITPWCTDANTAFIKYAFFDDRIGLHAWHLKADTKEYGPQHMAWIYSQSKERPYLSEDFDLYLSKEEIEKEKKGNIKFIAGE